MRFPHFCIGVVIPAKAGMMVLTPKTLGQRQYTIFLPTIRHRKAFMPYKPEDVYIEIAPGHVILDQEFNNKVKQGELAAGWYRTLINRKGGGIKHYHPTATFEECAQYLKDNQSLIQQAQFDEQKKL